MIIDNFSQNVKQEKWLRNLEDDLKPIVPFIENPNVTDIAIANKGEVIVEGMGIEKDYTGIFFDESTITRIIYASASILGVPIDTNNPIVEGTLPNWKIRIEGILPPRASEGPCYFIRRPASKIFTLEQYLEEKRITKDRYDLLIKHIKNRSNIIIGGGTGAGKTTFLNAVIDKMREFTPNDRFYIVEDASEIQCRAKDTVRIWAEGEACVKAVRIALRCNVSRIIFGEIRQGKVAEELLDAWNTGHTGNVSTVHADSSLLIISRLKELIKKEIAGEVPNIAQSVQLLVHMKKLNNEAFVNEIVETKQLMGSTFVDELEINGLIN